MLHFIAQIVGDEGLRIEKHVIEIDLKSLPHDAVIAIRQLLRTTL